MQLASQESLKKYKEIFDDIVKPELNKIDLIVRNAKDKLTDKLHSDAVSGSGVVSLGIASGFVSPEAVSVLTAHGGLQFGKGLLHNLNELLRSLTAAPESNFYYLWKAKQRIQS